MSTGRVFPFAIRGRRSVRLREHDYRSGTYFVTICANNRVPTFGEVVQRRVNLSSAGQVANACWLEIPRCFPHVELDAFVVMPDHIHGILCLVTDPVESSRPRRFGDAVPGSLSTIVGTYKSEVTKRINAIRDTPGQKVWQRNYYEHIVRNPIDLHQIRWYVITNPIRWGRRGNHRDPIERAGNV